MTTLHSRRSPLAGIRSRTLRLPGGIVLGAIVLGAIVLGAVVAGPLPASAAAAASQGAGEIPTILAAASRPAYTRRDRDVFIDGLGLDAAQTVQLDSILADYNTAFVAGLQAFQARVRETRPPAGQAATRYREEQVAMRRRMQQVLDTARAEAAEAANPEQAAAIIRAADEEMAELRRMLTERLTEYGPGAVEGRAAVDAMLTRMRQFAADWAADRDQLGDVTLSRIRETLRPEQDERWPALERQLVRRTLSLSRLSGEQVDLVGILERTVPSADVRALAAEPLARWERSIDEALRARNAELPALEARIRQLALAAADDPELAGRVRGPAARRVQLHQTVRDISLAGAAAIAATLPPRSAATFTAAVNQAGFPSLASPTPFDRLLDAALASDDVSPSERAELEALGAAYAEERAAVNVRIRAATLDVEPRELRDAPVGPPRYDQPTEPSPVSLAYRARRDLDARFAAVVRTRLGEARFAALPGARVWLR